MRLPARAAVTLAAAGAVLLPLASPAMACPEDDHGGKGHHGGGHGKGHDGKSDHGDKGGHHVRKHVVGGPTYVYDPYFKKVDTKVVTELDKRGTSVRIAVAGIPRKYWGKTMGTHVHEKKCGWKPASAGPHYQNPHAKKGTPLRKKEIWLDFKVEKGGKGYGKAWVPWRVDKKDARSVIIHQHRTDPKTGDAGKRLICTDAVFF
ncbi:superoxide dismutase family protein [Actinomadura sp. WMMB 499]|uniref:superoxide dismutase family protein n=1 Tax=Actinomadura sp. WMMB 499 TaxID=1219491 RepID=UPI0012489D1B|nr:superoxide dismutase family protein [Actinomadura sp. WMMB 499]QFG25003.1 superoxide dismutase family protein [Actinomadura sp. WMMB 499]